MAEQEQITNLTNQVKALNTQIAALTQNNQNLTTEKTNLTEQVAKKTLEIKDLNDGKNTLTKEVTTLKNDKTALSKQVKEITDSKTAEIATLAQLIKQHEAQQNDMIEKAIQFKKEKEEMEEQIKTSYSKLEKMESENDNLKKQMADLGMKKGLMSFNSEVDSQQKTDYTCKIQLSNLFQSKQPSINNPKELQSISQKKKSCIIVGILGKKYVGRTHILSLLTGKQFCDQSSHDDLSIYCHQDLSKDICYIDTKGLQQPIKLFQQTDTYSDQDLTNDDQNNNNNICDDKNNINQNNSDISDTFIDESNSIISMNDLNKTAEEINALTYRESVAREQLQTELILFISNVIIVVVNLIDKNDQDLIMQLKQNLNKKDIHKKLIVVHNLLFLNTKEQIEEQSAKIKEYFNLDEQRVSQEEYYFYDRENFNIKHFLVSNSTLADLQQYNELAIKSINNITKEVLHNTQYIEKGILEFLNRNYTNYVELSVKKTKEKQQSQQLSSYFSINKDTIKLNTEKFNFHRIKNYSKQLLTEQLKSIQYSIEEIGSEQMLIFVELPGNITDIQIEQELDSNTIIILAQKSLESNPQQITDNQRIYGQIILELEKPNFKYFEIISLQNLKTGVWKMDLKRKKTKNVVSFTES